MNLPTKRKLKSKIRSLQAMPENILSLSEAEARGFGNANTLKKAIYAGNLSAKLFGKTFVTTTESLTEAGYPKNKLTRK